MPKFYSSSRFEIWHILTRVEEALVNEVIRLFTETVRPGEESLRSTTDHGELRESRRVCDYSQR